MKLPRLGFTLLLTLGLALSATLSRAAAPAGRVYELRT